MRVQSALKSDRLCKSLTGLTALEFIQLVESFKRNLLEARIKTKSNRLRAFGGGRIGNLVTDEDKLFFILMYLKCYPTYDVLGWIVDFHRTRACQQVLFLLPVLEQTLGRQLVLPLRKISSPEEFMKLFPEIKEVFGDATERRIQRPKSQKRQRKLYSGKKKTHTRKNVILSDEKKRILVLTKTKSGRRHDKRLADKENLFQNLPVKVTAWVDTGFEGIQVYHPNSLIPVKRLRKSKHNPNPPPLTRQQKESNRLISSFRILAEHAIAGVKRYNCLQQPFRNKIKQLDDTFILLSAGLWNYHLQLKS